MSLHLLGNICYDRLGTRLKDQLPFDDCRHRVRGCGRSLLICLHGYLHDIIPATDVVIAVQADLQMARVLGEDSEGFFQFDLLPIQNVMSYNQHWHPLVDGRRTAESTQVSWTTGWQGQSWNCNSCTASWNSWGKSKGNLPFCMWLSHSVLVVNLLN